MAYAPVYQAPFGDLCSTGAVDAVRRYFQSNTWSQDDLQHGLRDAAKSGRDDIARLLLENGAELDFITKVYGRQSKSTRMMRVMLDYGWDINEETRGTPPLLITVVSDEAAVRWCLDHGTTIPTEPYRPPEPAHQHSNGRLLDAAAAHGSTTTFKLLLQLGAPIGHPLHSAAASHDDSPPGRGPMMDFLINELGINMNHIADDPDVYVNPVKELGTPLHYTAKHGHVKGLQWLLDHGADVHMKDLGGHSPLDTALFWHQAEAARILQQWTNRLM